MTSRIVETVKAPLRPFRHGAVAMTRLTLLERLFNESDIPKNLVISTGGAGTTFLMKHLSKFVQTNDPFDRDRIKHLPRLPEGWLDGRRVLFIHAPPQDVFRSIQRRKWLNMHAGELGCLMCQFTWGRLRQRFFERAVRNQVNGFCAFQSENIMLLEYDDIWSRVDEIAAFFMIEDEAFVKDFPARRSRFS